LILGLDPATRLPRPRTMPNAPDDLLSHPDVERVIRERFEACGMPADAFDAGLARVHTQARTATKGGLPDTIAGWQDLCGPVAEYVAVAEVRRRTDDRAALLKHPQVARAIRAILREQGVVASGDLDEGVTEVLAEAWTATEGDRPDSVERWKAVVRVVAKRFTVDEIHKRTSEPRVRVALPEGELPQEPPRPSRPIARAPRRRARHTKRPSLALPGVVFAAGCALLAFAAVVFYLRSSRHVARDDARAQNEASPEPSPDDEKPRDPTSPARRTVP
jgi:hypothetical protein